MWEIVYTKRAQKDAEKLSSDGLRSKAATDLLLFFSLASDKAKPEF